jgi:hypothetical protein
VQAFDPAIGRENSFQWLIIHLTSGLAARLGDIKCSHRTHSVSSNPEAGQVFAGPVPDRRDDSETSDQDSLFFLHIG